MQSGQEVKVHYVRSGLPLRIEEHFDGYENLDSDFILSQALQDQETYYKSFETSCGNQVGSSSTGSNGTCHPNGDGRRVLTVKVRLDEDVKRQLAIDEALAIALQEMENQTIESSSNRTATSEVKENGSGNSEEYSTASSFQVPTQDDIDPDKMTYEELQSLGEAIGRHCKGLSDELISYLPSSKYKAGGILQKQAA